MSLNGLSEPAPIDPVTRRNRKLAIVCALVFAGMIGAAYASVPLYKAFCQLTGYDGTVRRAQVAPGSALARKLTVRFDTNVRDLPWTFTAEQTSQTLHIGETGLAFFKVTNNGPAAITGRALFNVVPEQAGAYFQKLECFCFSDQTIGPGQTMEFPVVYFVDPKYVDDPETKDKGEVTLSYTFFQAVDAGAPQKRADAAPVKAPSALGGTARAGL